MPSFPGSIFSPASKNAGDVISTAHISNVDDEIVAIESGYLNGTARLNSSNSTLVSLSVSSVSTFAIRPVMPPPDAVKVYLDSTVTLGSSALSTIAWLAGDYETNSSLHSTGTNPSRLTPQSTGIYRFSAGLGFTANSTSYRQIDILDSSAGSVGAVIVDASTSGVMYLQATGYKRFDVTGGYAVCQATIGNGVSTLSLTTGVGVSWFAMEKL
mgnify:CR=1 FL=1